MLSCFCVRNSEEDVLYVGVNGGFLGICFGVERRMKPICGCNYIMDFKFSVCFIHYNKFSATCFFSCWHKGQLFCFHIIEQMKHLHKSHHSLCVVDRTTMEILLSQFESLFKHLFTFSKKKRPLQNIDIIKNLPNYFNPSLLIP